MKTFKRLLACLTALAMVVSLCAFTALADTDAQSDEVVIVLSDDGITVDGAAVSTSEDDAVYIANDIIYYEDLDYYADTGYEYGEGTDDDKHSAEEAAANTVVHITEAGTYRISGTLSCGQIFIDLGDDAKEDSTAVVTLILDGVNITCTVAPAVLFYSVYECDTAWVAYDEEEADSYEASAVQDTTAAGANVIIADGSENNITGSYVAKIYKNNGKSKKLYKFDGAFYSKMSMNIDGEDDDTGVLNIYAEYEGLDSELHLTINGGTINIQSQDDGINTNEDNVSVTTINGGNVHILAGLGDEGDGIDSNGYLMINGGVVIAIANPSADSGLDSDCGSYINGGTVLATGSTMDWSDEDTDSGLGTQPTMNLQFEEAQDSDEAIIVTDSDGNVVFAYDPDQDETTGSYNRGYQGAIISCADLEVGATYYVYIGGTVSGTDTNGLYDTSTITGVSGAVRQIYTGTDVGMENMPGTGNDNTGGPNDNTGGMGGDTGGMDDNTGGMDDNTGGMDDNTGGMDDNTGGMDDNTGGMDDNTGGMDDNTGGMDNNTGGMGGDTGGMGGDTGGMNNNNGGNNIDSNMAVSASVTVAKSAAAAALDEGTTYSNQFYLTDYVNDFSGVQDDPDYTVEEEETEPESTEPESTEPESTEPESTEPESTEPESTEPESTEPESTEPESTEPESTEPESTEPESTEPEETSTEETSTQESTTEETSAEETSTEETSTEETSTQSSSSEDSASAAVSYTVTTGSYVLDSGDTTSAVITVDADFDTFVSVSVAGSVLTEGTDYTAAEGSIIITFTESYLESLEAGTYEVVITLTDGSAVTSLVISDAETTTTSASSDDSGDTATGDNNNLATWTCLAAAALLGLAYALIRRRKFN